MPNQTKNLKEEDQKECSFAKMLMEFSSVTAKEQTVAETRREHSYEVDEPKYLLCARPEALSSFIFFRVGPHGDDLPRTVIDSKLLLEKESESNFSCK